MIIISLVIVSLLVMANYFGMLLFMNDSFNETPDKNCVIDSDCVI